MGPIGPGIPHGRGGSCGAGGADGHVDSGSSTRQDDGFGEGASGFRLGNS
ncbi:MULTISPECIES: hypothetical protein [Anaerotruncus]|nr:MULTISPECIES: hypothetical protein [Anaerotruncus]